MRKHGLENHYRFRAVNLLGRNANAANELERHPENVKGSGMQTIEERDVDKSGWPPGPWMNEPDRKQWMDEETKLPCLIVRNGGAGNLCGYVGVPPSHPLYGKCYSDRVKVVDLNAIQNTSEAKPYVAWFCEALREPDGTVGVDSILDCHGGITYAAKCIGRICHKVDPGEPDDVWWLGFDCAHCDDLSPGADPMFRGGMYRDVDYVAGECRKLAKQLAEFAGEVVPPVTV